MAGKVRVRLAAVLLIALCLPHAESGWSAESSHVDGFDVGKRSEDIKKDEIDKRDDAVVKAREPWRNRDLTNEPKTEFHDGEQLSRKIKEQKTAEDLTKKLIDSKNEKGNYGIGSGSRRAADIVGRDWVGANARLASDKKTMVSVDNERVYRPPTMKKGLGKEQANFERIDKISGSIISNAHLDIEE